MSLSVSTNWLALTRRQEVEACHGLLHSSQTAKSLDVAACKLGLVSGTDILDVVTVVDCLDKKNIFKKKYYHTNQFLRNKHLLIDH